MKKFATILAATAACVATPAFAQEEDRSGFFIGAVAGWDSPSIEEEGASYGDSGVLYGLTAGYDFDANGVVIGIEGEITDSTAGDTEEDAFFAGDRLELDAAHDIYVGARLGFAAGDNGLLYLKGGYTTGRVELEYFDGTDTFTEGDNLDGFRVGGGYEAKLGDAFTGRIEYRYSDYGEYRFLGEPTGLSADRHQVAVVIGAKL